MTNKAAPKIKGIDFLKNDYTIVYFYPRDNTPGCTIEAKDFTCLTKDFKKLNTEVIGISKDSVESHEKFILKHSLNLKLLSDHDHKIQEKYKVWQPKKFMGKEFMGTVRSTFLINNKGKIIQEWINVRVKNHAQNVLDFIKSLE